MKIVHPPEIPTFDHQTLGGMKNLMVIALMLVSLAAASQGIVVSDELKSNCVIMDVKGKQGWQFNQVIRYGDFYTSKAKRGWPTGFDLGFVNRFRLTKEKISYTQYSPDSLSCSVLAVSKFLNFETEFLYGFMGLSYKYEDTFAGCIIPGNDTANSWEFMVSDADVVLDKSAGCGIAKDKKGNQIVIKGVTLLEGQAKWTAGQVWGFEFFQDGKSIAAVSITGNGKVYMKNGLPPFMKLVISALSSSLLLRHDLSQ
jgi:hypothetical protein